MRWGWLFDLELWLLRREQPRFLMLRDEPEIHRGWRLARRPVSALTRRLERRGRML